MGPICFSQTATLVGQKYRDLGTATVSLSMWECDSTAFFWSSVFLWVDVLWKLPLGLTDVAPAIWSALYTLIAVEMCIDLSARPDESGLYNPQGEFSVLRGIVLFFPVYYIK